MSANNTSQTNLTDYRATVLGKIAKRLLCLLTWNARAENSHMARSSPPTCSKNVCRMQPYWRRADKTYKSPTNLQVHVLCCVQNTSIKYTPYVTVYIRTYSSNIQTLSVVSGDAVITSNSTVYALPRVVIHTK
jgi:hypothetical protein